MRAPLCALFGDATLTSLVAEPIEVCPAKKHEWKQAGPGEFSIKDYVATSEKFGGM